MMTLRERLLAIKDTIQDRMPDEVQNLFENISSNNQQQIDFPHRQVVPLNMGLCSDDLPVRVDLNDPDFSPMVAISNEVKELQEWIEHILSGLTEQRSEGEVEIALLKRRSTNLDRSVKAAEDKGLLVSLFEISPRNEWEYLYDLAQLAENRFQNRTEDAPPVLILIEDLTFLKYASPDLQLTFEWLLQYGNEVGIQTIAAVTCEDGYTLGRWLRYFPARLFGSITQQDDLHFNYHDAIPPIPRKIRYAGTTFAVWNNTSWLFFALKNPQTTNLT